MKPALAVAVLLSLLPSAEAAITNGNFEAGLEGWRPLWTREANTGVVSLERKAPHRGSFSAKIEHRAEQDWSFEPALRVPVQAGDQFELEGWFKYQGSGSVTLCVSTWNAQNQPVEWSYGARSTSGSRDWTHLRSRLVVPPGVTAIQPRVIGYGPGTIWVDDYALVAKGNLKLRRSPDLPATLTLSNTTLRLSLRTDEAVLTVSHLRTGRTWSQQPAAASLITAASASEATIKFTLFHNESGLDLTNTLRLDPDRPEFTWAIAGAGELPVPIRFPYPFASRAGEYLVVPMNEGISYPVEDASIEPFRLIAYGGHGISMGFWGATDGTNGYLAILETPDDAAVRIARVDGRLVLAPEWDPQRLQFGEPRRLRYVFFERGGHVAMAKRYRAYAQQIGRLKTLAEKRQTNPEVDRLIGAVNVWCWDRDALSIVQEMQATGITRILWSNRQSPDNLRALNALGVLTSRYDIYQDVMDPTNFQFLRGVHSDWTTAAWPQDVVRQANDDWLRGWGVRGKQGEWFHCGVICDRQALPYARERIPNELATHPYRCRFIDTTTAAPWHECYHPDHPMTRTDSRLWKMRLLEYVSRDLNLVTGCETGHDAAVPYLHYFEGMLSLGPYRVPDAGRDMARIWTEVPERVAKFQLGHTYRLPLWELVYHDCVVAQWYWGDYNNKLPALWDRRDLFNLLYGTPPMFMFNRELWQKEKARFVQSYQNTCPHVRQIGYAEMTDHRFLTPDRTVQQTQFANGTTITVNFGSVPHRLANGRTVTPLGFLVVVN